jgi:hypothetical protein
MPAPRDRRLVQGQVENADVSWIGANAVPSGFW